MNYLNEPVQCLSNVIGHAQYSDIFPNISYVDRNWDKWHELSREEKAKFANSNQKTCPDLWVQKSRRPHLDEIRIVGFFPQMWGSTALGFPGIGGAAMTSAYTIILSCGQQYSVYFGGTYAYSVINPTPEFFTDLNSQNMKSLSDSYIYSTITDELELKILEECSHVFRKSSKIISKVLSQKNNPYQQKDIEQSILNLTERLKLKFNQDNKDIKNGEVRIY